MKINFSGGTKFKDIQTVMDALDKTGEKMVLEYNSTFTDKVEEK